MITWRQTGRHPYNGSVPGEYRKRTTRTGTFSANNWGLQDMHGNVWEWVEGCYDEEDSGSSACQQRVIRGGSWYYGPQKLRSADRVKYAPEGRGDFIGFRLARSAP